MASYDDCDSCEGARDEIASLRQDAMRWRALMACPRIRMYGSAGIDPKTGERTSPGEVHFGAEFWSDRPVTDEQSGTFSTQWGRHALTALADAIIANQS